MSNNIIRESCLPDNVNKYISITFASVDTVLFGIILLYILKKLDKYVKGPIKLTLFVY